MSEASAGSTVLFSLLAVRAGGRAGRGWPGPVGRWTRRGRSPPTGRGNDRGFFYSLGFAFSFCWLFTVSLRGITGGSPRHHKMCERVSFEFGQPGSAFAALQGRSCAGGCPALPSLPPQPSLPRHRLQRTQLDTDAQGLLCLPPAPQLCPALGVIMNDNVMFFS